MKPCCETAHLLNLHSETVSAKIQELKVRLDKAHERWRYYDEPLSEHDLWKITEEVKKLAELART